MSGGSKRLDLLLKELYFPNLSRSAISNIVSSGLVSVDGLVQKQPSRQVLPSQNIELGSDADALSLSSLGSFGESVALDDSVKVVFENEFCAVVNKPAGLSVHRGHNKNEVTLVDHLVKIFGSGYLSTVRGDDFLGIVHRLDKDTSGLMLVAKNNSSYEFLTQQISSKTCKRVYLAFCFGTFMPPSGLIKKYLMPDRKDFRRYVASDSLPGKESLTDYAVRNVFLKGAISMVEFSLLTGRTHQIRVHALSMGHPILGDNLYKDLACNRLLRGVDPDVKNGLLFGVKRQMLHAYKISFLPGEGLDPVELECDFPEDMKGVLGLLS